MIIFEGMDMRTVKRNEKMMKILSRREEEKLNEYEKNNYYKSLRIFCRERKLTNTTIGATTIAPKLKYKTGIICEKLCQFLAGKEVAIITDGLENIPMGPVVFASTHQGILDNFVWITDCPKHTIIFHGAETNKVLLLAQINTGLILVTKDKKNKVNRINSKLDMMSLLLRGHSIYICPETAWNLSPNRLHLPINYGFLDVAQKVQVPVVPIVIEYTYDSTSKVEKITRVHIHYCKAIIVKEEDSLYEKMQEYQESISTARWNLIEEKGISLRSEITNLEYINYLEGNFRNLKIGKIDINRERNGIQGADEEFYLFHHINDVPWNEQGEFLGTEEVERLKRINLVHGI